MHKIAVVGCGVVGEAVARGFEWKGAPHVVRIDPRLYPNMPLTDVLTTNFTFVCVPTPTLPLGKQDTSAVSEVVGQLAEIGYRGIVVVKSTVLPHVAQELCSRQDVMVAVSPEFLTARTALTDFIGQKHVVIGAFNQETAQGVISLFRHFFLEASISCVLPAEAMLVKYIANVSLAVKVSVMNELRQVADEVGADWAVIRRCLRQDRRVGISHTEVPGPDGHRGFGGACFPKDMLALAAWAEQQGCVTRTMRGALGTNLVVRDDPELRR